MIWAVLAAVGALFFAWSAGVFVESSDHKVSASDTQKKDRLFGCLYSIISLALMFLAIIHAHGASRGYPALVLPDTGNREVYEMLNQTKADDKFYIVVRTPASDIHHIEAGEPRFFQIEAPIPEGTRFVTREGDKLVVYTPKAEKR